MSKVDKELKDFEATNSTRILIQEATTPITNQFNQVVLKVNQLRDRLLFNSEKIAEMETFFRRISFFQRDFDKLWNQIQELEMQIAMDEKRRELDLKEIASNIDKLKVTIGDITTNIKINSNTILSLSKQHNELVKDTVNYKESITNKYCEMEIIATEAKEYCTTNIEAIQAKVSKINTSLERYNAQVARLEAELKISNQRIAGTYQRVKNRTDGKA